MKTIKILLIVLAAIATMSSCQKEPLPITVPETMNDLVVDPSFNWSTSADYEFSVQGPVNRVIMITAPDGTIYKKGLITANQPLKLKINLPAYVKSVSLRYNGQIVELTLTSTQITYLFK